MSETSSGDGRDPVEQLLESFLARWRRGERPSLEEYAARCPERADEIRELFPAMVEMEQLKPGRRGGHRARWSGRRPGPSRPPGPSRRIPSGWATIASSASSARGAWGSSTRPSTSRSRSRVALKVMHRRFRPDRTYLRRFRREARSAAGLHHTNIVPVFDFGEHDGICYYAMQYIAGLRPGPGARRRPPPPRRGRGGCGPAPADGPGDLSATEASADPGLGRHPRPADRPVRDRPGHARRNGPCRPPRRSTTGRPSPLGFQAPDDRPASSLGGRDRSGTNVLLRQVGAGLLPRGRPAGGPGRRRAGLCPPPAKVVHRDIKPSNLLLDAQGNVWVTDFGLAKLVEGEDLSQSHDLAGTLRFMAPERFQGVTDRRGDIYALGATLYEMLTLRPAFAERDQVQLIDQIAARAADAACGSTTAASPATWRRSCSRSLAKDPKDRCDQAGRAAGRAAAVPGRPADPVAAGRAGRAVPPLVQAQPVAGRGQHRRRRC